MRFFYLFLYSCFSSLAGGLTAFLFSLRWYAIADMLRGIGSELVILGLLLLLPAKASAWAVILLWLPIFAFTAANVGHIVIYGNPISSFAVKSTLETSFSEATEFLNEFATPSLCIALCLLLALSVIVMLKAKKATTEIQRNKVSIIAALLMLCVPSWFMFSKGDRFLRSNTSYVIIKTLATHKDELAQLQSLHKLREAQAFSNIELLDDADGPRTYLFVIGEAMNRHHVSVYGYHRKTTPHLENLVSQGMLQFLDTASASTHTIPSLRKTLLFHDLLPEDRVLEAPSIIGLLKGAGFVTYWISNQTASSDGLTGTALIAGDADVQRFVNRAGNEGASTSYDENLLPLLRSILNEPGEKKAIFMHLLGSHLSYGLRYPSAFNQFKDVADIPDKECRPEAKKKYINEYDNSIVYTDHILNETVKMLHELPGSNLFVYFSDHGQEVYDSLSIRGQDAKKPTRHMFDVPFLIWYSPEYEANNRIFVEQVKSRLDAPFSLGLFGHSAAELARISFGEFVPERSLFSPAYKPLSRRLPDGKKYSDLPVVSGKEYSAD